MSRKFTLGLTLAIILALAVSMVAMAQAPAPTITSDLPDYGPGDTVTLTGAGWQADEAVHVFVNDDLGSSWNYPADVVADGDGAFTLSFQLPSWFVATYSVTATGPLSGTATTTFADGALQFVETGLPNGTEWKVTWNGNTQSSTTNTISFGGQAAGPFGYTVLAVTGYTASPASGTASRPQSGNTQVDITFTVVSDTTPPAWTVPTDFSVEATGPTGAVVTYSTSVTDPDDAVSSQSCTPASGGTFPLGATTVNCTATDSHGNTGTASFKVTVVDTTGPVLTLPANMLLEATGPSGAAATYTASASDLVDGPVTIVCSPASGATFALGTTAVNCSATDAHSNTANGSFTVTVQDTTPPTITLVSRLPAANSNGWNNTSVTVTWGCSDLVGVLSPTIAVTKSVEGAGQSATGTCTDTSGNTASNTVSGINIDKTKPTISAAISAGTAGSNGWYISDVTVSFTCSDLGGSGIPAGTCPGNQTLNTEGTGIASTAQTVTDAAGNVSDLSNTITVNIDKTKPTISAAISAGTLGSNGWYVSDVTVSFTCSDLGGSGIPAGACPVVQVLSDEGDAVSSTAETVKDAAGNESEPSNVVTVKIDKSKPTIVAAITDGTLGSNGWYVTDVTVGFTCDDEVSGIPELTCPADQTLSTEATAVSSTAETVTDVAGNVSDPSNVVTVKIDKTAPSVSLVGGPADGASYYFGFVPAAPTCSASDALSGIDGSCSVSGYSTALGSQTVTASATDKAGNSASASATYTVLAWTLSGFYQPVDMPTATSLVYNTVKNGSTVPLKFDIFAGSTELTDVAYVKSLTYAKTSCDATATTADVETTATGGTSLRYDATAGQFVYNWQTPKTAGTCYRVTMTTQDASTLVAYFKLK